jgi:hypothetical protein
MGKSNWSAIHDETINELINQFDKILIELLEMKMLEQEIVSARSNYEEKVKEHILDLKLKVKLKQLLEICP